MANFKKVPWSAVQHAPQALDARIRTLLEQSGTYTLFDEAKSHLRVPLGNNTWKGPQARLIGVWGGDSAGGRLRVTACSEIVDVIAVSDRAVADHLWAYVVVPRAVGQTQLEAKTSGGSAYSQPLPVTVLPDTARPAGLGAFDPQQREDTIRAIVAECARQGCIQAQTAYILATTEHETSNTFRPIRETGSPAHPMGNERQRRGMRYYPYYGRGYVQLTWQRNYQSFGGDWASTSSMIPTLRCKPTSRCT